MYFSIEHDNSVEAIKKSLSNWESKDVRRIIRVTAF